MAHVRDLQQASTPKLLFELSWLEVDQENLLLVSDLILSRRIIFSALWHYVNMYVNFIKVKSWINFRNPYCVEPIFIWYQILNCNPERFCQSARVSLSDKLDRGLLLYLMWQTGQLTKRQIGERFGITCTAVSWGVGAFKDLLNKNNKLKNKLNRIKSQMKI
jgi:hypothetical protein